MTAVQSPLAQARPPCITLRDEADLEWFFGQGQVVFERSTMGGVLDRQRLTLNSARCGACKGTGFDRQDNSCPRCCGSGMTARGRTGYHHGPWAAMCCATERCHACRGASGRDCDDCHGRGYVDVDRVFVAHEQSHESGYEPDDGTLTRFARVSRSVARLSLLTVAVLQSYYGPIGVRFGQAERQGRIFSIYPLTDAVHTFLSKRNNPLELPSYQLLDNEWHRDQERPRQTVRDMFAAAHKQALARYAMASAEWMESRGARL